MINCIPTYVAPSGIQFGHSAIHAMNSGTYITVWEFLNNSR